MSKKAKPKPKRNRIPWNKFGRWEIAILPNNQPPVFIGYKTGQYKDVCDRAEAKFGNEVCVTPAGTESLMSRWARM